ncbi:MAG: glycosyltransferase family 39 protein [Candidatus Aenigmatarchaeota archaeon]
MKSTRRFGKYPLLSIIVLASIIRMLFFVGFGLGDDPYYARTAKYFMEDGFRSLSLEFGSNYRIGLWIPVSFFFKTLGVNDISFILFPFLSSLGLIVSVYLIGKELFDEKVGLISAFFLAISPFDSVFSSTMTIDIITSFFAAMSFLCFIRGNKARNRTFIFYYLLAGGFLLWSYFIKPVAFMPLVFIPITLIEIKSIKKHAIFYLIVALLFSISFMADYAISGDFLHYFHQELKYAPRPGLFQDIGISYFKWMFTGDMSFGILMFGYFFYLATLSLIYCIANKIKNSYNLLMWFFMVFLLLEFLPMGISPYAVAPRFFRYAHAFFVPAVLVSAVALNSIWNFSISRSKKHSSLTKMIFLIIFSALTCASLIEGAKLSNLYRDSFGDSTEASLFLLKLDPKPIYSDNAMSDRFDFYTGYERSSQLMWYVNNHSFQMDIIEKRNYEPLKNISDAYVVVGGARSPDTSPHLMLSSCSFEKTNNWELIATFKRNLTEYRAEPLKIYYVPEIV